MLAHSESATADHRATHGSVARSRFLHAPCTAGVTLLTLAATRTQDIASATNASYDPSHRPGSLKPWLSTSATRIKERLIHHDLRLRIHDIPPVRSTTHLESPHSVQTCLLRAAMDPDNDFSPDGALIFEEKFCRFPRSSHRNLISGRPLNWGESF
ncbi:uncharacterized protein ARMOST_12513 [Armillaria ostoyae]|uniref:Uncharacterized protein n=1 Tax=Armillaria ostoyae TaxID=47428 RepID=A0A284RK87_ARMOS|nr:uncharacterized protein ARMOST_12513 [Armillaria ostoyae]